MRLAHHLSLEEISCLVCISQRSVRRYTTLFESTGDVVPTPYHHGPQKILGQITLLTVILEYPGIYLHEIQAKLSAKYEVWNDC